LLASIRETQTDIIAKSAHRVRDYLCEINVELITVRQGVDDIIKKLPAIRDTAGKATVILNELSVTFAKILTFHDKLPMMSGKIITIHNDIPVLAGKVTVIHDELPAIRDVF
jgi:ACT domain-containing protein